MTMQVGGTSMVANAETPASLGGLDEGGSRWQRVVDAGVIGLALGAAAGLVVLGVGGRVAMRAIAIASDAPPSFTVGGTLTVVFLGVVSGVGGGLLYALLHLLVPRRRLVRSALFAVAIVLLTLRGLRPIQPLAFSWFMPLALVYAVIVEVGYAAWSRRRAQARGRGDPPYSSCA